MALIRKRICRQRKTCHAGGISAFGGEQHLILFSHTGLGGNSARRAQRVPFGYFQTDTANFQIATFGRLYFYIISPSDYYKFFIALKNQSIDSFKSQFEENLVIYTQSRKVVSGKQAEKSKEDQELLELYDGELSKAIKNFDDKKLENEILKIDLQNAETTIGSLKEALVYQPKVGAKEKIEGLKISTPFNICVLGEVVGEDLIREKLRGFFAKYDLKATDWDIAFIGNSKIRNSDVLSGLKKGQTKYNVIITGQIYHHSGKGNQSANILTELKKDRYINHIVGCSPKELLTIDNVIEKLDKYFNQKF